MIEIVEELKKTQLHCETAKEFFHHAKDCKICRGDLAIILLEFLESDTVKKIPSFAFNFIGISKDSIKNLIKENLL